MDRNRRERTSPATNNRMFHPASATSSPYEPVVPLLAGKIRFARYRSVGLAAARTDCPDRHFSLSATFLLCGFEIVDVRASRGQSQLSVWRVCQFRHPGVKFGRLAQILAQSGPVAHFSMGKWPLDMQDLHFRKGTETTGPWFFTELRATETHK